MTIINIFIHCIEANRDRLTKRIEEKSFLSISMQESASYSESRNGT